MGETNNDLKGLAWSPDSQWLAVMYHHGSGGYIAIVDAVTGEHVKYIPIDQWYHHMEFSDDGKYIIAGTAALAIGSLDTPVPPSPTHAPSLTPTPTSTPTAPTDTWAIPGAPIPTILVRLSMPPDPLQAWKKESGEKNDFNLRETFAWFSAGKEANFAAQYNVIREASLEHVSAEKYLPLESGRQWTYRRRVYPYWGLKGEKEDEIKEVGYTFFWKSGFLADGDVLDVRGQMEIVTGVKPASSIGGPDVSEVEFTIKLKQPIPYDGGEAFPVEAFPSESVRDGRYGDKSFGQTLWLRRPDEAGVEFIEVLFWESPPPQSETIKTERPILFDAGFSRVRTYGPPENPLKQVIQGYIVELDPGLVKVPAGEFANTLRMTEYVEPRGDYKARILRPESVPDNEPDHGWVTISWYAPGVGLIKELQYTKGGRLTYELQLVSTSTALPTSLRIPNPPSGFQKGISYASWWQGQYSTPAADQSLKNLADTGANWIALIVTGYQETITSTQITRSLPKTPTDADLVHVIAMAHDLGLKVMLKPHVDLSNDPTHWRGQIGTGFASEAEWQAWFASYRDFINHYATLAQDNGVEQLCAGTELVGTSWREQEWRNVIAEVRSRFTGAITYASNHGGEEASIKWWDAVDYIGVDAYYSLTNKDNPTVAELKDAWIQRGYVTALENLANRYDEPIIFTEIGYRSVDGTNKAPWAWQSSATIDLQEQADCYQAILETFWGKPWFAGIYWWNWDTDPNKGGPNDPDYTPFGKPAEEVLKAYYLSN